MGHHWTNLSHRESGRYTRETAGLEVMASKFWDSQAVTCVPDGADANKSVGRHQVQEMQP